MFTYIPAEFSEHLCNIMYKYAKVNRKLPCSSIFLVCVFEKEKAR